MLNFVPRQWGIIGDMTMLEFNLLAIFLIMHTLVISYLVIYYNAFVFSIINILFGLIIVYMSVKEEPITPNGPLHVFNMMANICVLLIIQSACPPICSYMIMAGFMFLLLSAIVPAPTSPDETNLQILFYLFYLQMFMFGIIIYSANLSIPQDMTKC